MTKKTSTPMKPPGRVPVWTPMTAMAANARRPSMSGRYALWPPGSERPCGTPMTFLHERVRREYMPCHDPLRDWVALRGSQLPTLGAREYYERDPKRALGPEPNARLDVL